MDSAISKALIPKLYFLYLTPPLGLELWASEVRHYLKYQQNQLFQLMKVATKTSDSFLYLTPPLGLELWSPEVTGDYL